MADVALNIQRAKPEDAEILAPMIYQAGQKITDYTLGVKSEESLKYIAYCIRNDIGFYGFSHQHLLLIDGEIALVSTIYRGDKFVPLVLQSIFSSFRFFSMKQSLQIFWRSLDIGKLYEKPHANSLFLANICVPECFRSTGCFSDFHKTFVLPLAKMQGVSRIELDVDLENPRAKSLYERLGFQDLYTRHYKGKADLKGITRMISPIPQG